MTKFYKILDRAWRGEIVHIDCDMIEFNHPRTVQFGVAWEERLQKVFKADEVNDDPVGYTILIMQTLENGDSIWVEGELEKDVAKLLDHAYGVMTQFYSKLYPRYDDDLCSPLGLLSIEDTFGYMEGSRVVLSDFTHEVTEQIIRERGGEELSARIDKNARLVMPLPNLDLVNETDETFLRPFINYDTYFGGQIGWYRLERAYQQVYNDESAFQIEKEREIRIHLAMQLNELADDVRKVENIIEPDVKETVTGFLESARELYL